MGRYLSCTERIAQGKDFELILTVKMKTIHPVEAPSGSEFPAICNHCKVMTAWSRKTSKVCEQLLHFFLKKTIHLKLPLLRGSQLKICRASPTFGSQGSRFYPNRFTFGGVIAERVKTVFAPCSISNIGSSRLYNKPTALQYVTNLRQLQRCNCTFYTKTV